MTDFHQSVLIETIIFSVRSDKRYQSAYAAWINSYDSIIERLTRTDQQWHEGMYLFVTQTWMKRILAIH